MASLGVFFFLSILFLFYYFLWVSNRSLQSCTALRGFHTSRTISLCSPPIWHEVSFGKTYKKSKRWKGRMHPKTEMAVSFPFRPFLFLRLHFSLMSSAPLANTRAGSLCVKSRMSVYAVLFFFLSLGRVFVEVVCFAPCGLCVILCTCVCVCDLSPLFFYYYS